MASTEKAAALVPSNPDSSSVDTQKLPVDILTEEKTLSKNQLRKLRRKQQWEEKREDRKTKRKEKRHAKQARRREEVRAKVAEAKLQGLDPKSILGRRSQKKLGVRTSIAIVIDNDFHQYMREGEFFSITSQITRCYSDNRKAPFQSHLVMSDWKGPLLDRFNGALMGAYKNWKGVHFTNKDFLEACKEISEQLKQAKDTEKVCPMLTSSYQNNETPAIRKDTDDDTQVPDIEETEHTNIVYLTSESPYTIERLEPGVCYVVGGIVDRNREKGLCYRRAKERGVRTAKLPIGEYLQMASRKVLATNHVVEIMLKWLETGDWGASFLEVIPKRKGGKLKGEIGDGVSSGSNDGSEHEDSKNTVEVANLP